MQLITITIRSSHKWCLKTAKLTA